MEFFGGWVHVWHMVKNGRDGEGKDLSGIGYSEYSLKGQLVQKWKIIQGKCWLCQGINHATITGPKLFRRSLLNRNFFRGIVKPSDLNRGKEGVLSILTAHYTNAADTMFNHRLNRFSSTIVHFTKPMPGAQMLILHCVFITGTRFRPLSLELPKPLFPIAGYPLIHHHIEAASKVCYHL